MPTNAIRLLLRRRKSRRHRQDEGPPRRQGRGPRRDDEPRVAGSARVHDHDGGLPLLHEGEALAEGARGRGARTRSRASRSSPRRASASKEAPLLFSVRSGAPVSMPGMMDTVLNLGLNDETVLGLAKKSDNARFAWDSYRRFVTMFGDVVLGIHYGAVRARPRPAARRERRRPSSTPTRSRRSALAMKEVVRDAQGHFPTDPWEQLQLAIDAVFKSFDTPRAKYYRKSHGISEDTGTGVNVQAMVFGNMGPTSATGVCFTRDPKSGLKVFFGEWLPNAQGEDVVVGLAHAASALEESTRRDGSGAVARSGDAEGLRGARRAREATRSALQGHAGHRVHDRGRHALHAADAHGKAHARCRGPDRRRPRPRGRDLDRGGAQASRSQDARDGAPPRARSRTRRRTSSPRASTRRRARRPARSCSTARKRRRPPSAGSTSILVRQETSPGGHPGHDARAGRAHVARRTDLARRRRRARHGQTLRRRLHGHHRSTTGGSSSTRATPSYGAATGSRSTAAPAR